MSRIISISDINGYYDEFVKLLRKVKFDGNKDKLVILGNFIDLGPKSFATLILMKKLKDLYKCNVQIIAGIHEVMLKKSLNVYLKMGYFEEDTFDTYNKFTRDNMLTLKTIDAFMNKNQQQKIIEWLDSLPIIKIHKTKKNELLIFTPCAVDAKQPLDKQDDNTILIANKIGKDFFKNPCYSNCITIFGGFYTSNIILETLNKKDVSIWYDMKYYDKIGINCFYHGTGVMGALIYDEDTNEMDQVYYKKGE